MKDKGEPAILPRIVSDPPGLLQARRPQVALKHAQYKLFFLFFSEISQVLEHNTYTRIRTRIQTNCHGSPPIS